MIPYCQHEILPEDRAVVDQVLMSDRLTQGPAIASFEGALAQRTASAHAVAVSSGTSALWTALLALGVKPGDEVLVPSLSFVATANAVLLAGATPVFVDVSEESLSLDPVDVERKITPRTAGAIIVHFAGHIGDWQACQALLGSDRFLLEDACHALGAEDAGVPAGGLGDAGCFSFHPAKHVAMGEGGAVTTQDSEIARRCLCSREHGIERDARRFEGLGLPAALAEEERGGWVYEMQGLAANHRLSDLGAALGESQLARLDENLLKRRSRAAIYQKAFADDSRIRILHERAGTRSAWHLFPILLETEVIKGGRAAVYRAMQAEGIGVQVHYIPIHLQPYYRQRLGMKFGDLPKTEASYLSLLTLPLFPGLLEKDQERVIDVLRSTLDRLKR